MEAAAVGNVSYLSLAPETLKGFEDNHIGLCVLEEGCFVQEKNDLMGEEGGQKCDAD